MDLNEPVAYRDFAFNSVLIGPDGISEGCTIESVTEGNVEVVGYTEKRSLDDGYDASDVYLGRRILTFRGTLYGSTRARLYDSLRQMRYAVNPRLAYLEDPGAQGYLPLTFSEPTNWAGDWPDGQIPLMLRVRAQGGVRATFARHASGGDPNADLAMPYEVSFEARDPRIYCQQRVESYMEGASGSFLLTNRGGHPVPLNVLLSATSNTDNDRIFTLTGGGGTFTATIPKCPTSAVLRLDGERKLVSLQVGEVESLRMDLRAPNAPWPILAPGDTDFVWTYKRDDDSAGALVGNSLAFFREAFS